MPLSRRPQRQVDDTSLDSGQHHRPMRPRPRASRAAEHTTRQWPCRAGPRIARARRGEAARRDRDRRAAARITKSEQLVAAAIGKRVRFGRRAAVVRRGGSRRRGAGAAIDALVFFDTAHARSADTRGLPADQRAALAVVFDDAGAIGAGATRRRHRRKPARNDEPTRANLEAHARIIVQRCRRTA
jgi:hypothetical protein